MSRSGKIPEPRDVPERGERGGELVDIVVMISGWLFGRGIMVGS